VKKTEVNIMAIPEQRKVATRGGDGVIRTG
jgi:hypothetical protein